MSHDNYFALNLVENKRSSLNFHHQNIFIPIYAQPLFGSTNFMDLTLSFDHFRTDVK